MSSTGLSVAVTGATSDLGRLLLPRLERDPEVARIAALDVATPRELGPKARFHRVDLAKPGGERELEDALSAAEPDVLYHLAFVAGRRHGPSAAHELEVAGSLRLLTAVAQRPVRTLIVPSLTALYGARPQHPALLPESTPLLECPESRLLRDRVEVEKQLAEFQQRYPQVAVLVLRFAPIVGPTSQNPITRWLSARVVPTLLGFDPLWQVVHEEDAAEALHLAARTARGGAFNVVGRGVISLSALIRAAGSRPLPLPAPVARTTIRALHAAGVASVPMPLLEFTRFGWVADGSRAERELGFLARYDCREAAATVRRSAA